MADRASHHDVRILWIDHHVADTPGVIKSHQLPGLARVSRFVDSLADRNVTANPGFTRAGPNDVGVRRSNRERADGGNRLIIENRLPVNTAIEGLEDAS